MDERDIITVVARRYGIEALSVMPLRQEGDNSYRFEADAGAFVLQTFRHDDRARVENLARLYRLLSDYQIATPRIQMTRSGDLTAEANGHRLLLRSYVPGQTQASLDESMTWQIGHALARLHKVPAPPFVPNEHRHARACQSLVAVSGADSYGHWLAGQLVAVRAQLPTGLPGGLIHGELSEENVIFVNGELQAILDLESACRQAYALDVGVAIVGTCVSNGIINRLKACALLAGYQAERLLTTAERRALPVCVEYGAVLASCLQYRKQLTGHASKPPERQEQMMQLAQRLRNLPDIATFDVLHV